MEVDYAHKLVLGDKLATEIVGRVFNQTDLLLPDILWYKDRIATDENWHHYNAQTKTIETYQVRHVYLKKSFPILTHEFFLKLREICAGLSVSELCCGAGWMSHWMRRYGVGLVDSIDNGSWLDTQPEMLDFVTRGDSIEYVRNHPKINLFVLSWPPYEDDTAAEIWEAMAPGQKLLYVGEGDGGCTANDRFFDLTAGAEVEAGLEESFISFFGIHDRPILFEKS